MLDNHTFLTGLVATIIQIAVGKAIASSSSHPVSEASPVPLIPRFEVIVGQGIEKAMSEPGYLNLHLLTISSYTILEKFTDFLMNPQTLVAEYQTTPRDRFQPISTYGKNEGWSTLFESTTGYNDSLLNTLPYPPKLSLQDAYKELLALGYDDTFQSFQFYWLNAAWGKRTWADQPYYEFRYFDRTTSKIVAIGMDKTSHVAELSSSGPSGHEDLVLPGANTTTTMNDKEAVD